ncbi:hypothetical protein ACSBR2_029842 [Camellia fascicularis]
MAFVGLYTSSSIMHKAHEHPLILKEIGRNEGCAACDQSCGMLSFGCGISSCSFNLHCACALLPSIFNHRYDEHPFILTYAPIENGPDEYWCEFCENQIDPKWWFYHYTCCDKSACAKCIRESEFPNAKLGPIFTFASHPHPLTLVQASYMRVRCDACNRHIVSGNRAFKCEHCEIMLCETCVWYRPTKWKALSDSEETAENCHKALSDSEEEIERKLEATLLQIEATLRQAEIEATLSNTSTKNY